MLSKQQKQRSLKDKFRNLSIDKRAFLYVFFMGVTGAIVGTVDSQIAIKQCMNSENCVVENLTEMQVSKIGVGTCAGMIAATLLSVPALLEEE